MANVKVKVIKGSVNGVNVGEEVTVDSHDAKWLEDVGYVEKVVAKSKPKPKPKADSEKEADKDGEDK